MIRYLWEHPTLIIAGYGLILLGFIKLWHAKVYRDEPSLGDELEVLEEQLEPAFQFPPKWKDDAHIELEKRERVGIRGPEFEHRPERVVSVRRAA